MPFFKNPQRRLIREIKVFSIMQAEYPLSAAGRGKQGRRVLSSHTRTGTLLSEPELCSPVHG